MHWSKRNSERAYCPRRGFFAARAGYSICISFVLLTALAAVRAQAPQPQPSRFVVVLDAAHGGDDTGAKLTNSAGQPLAEKAYTLALSGRLRSLLNARGIQVVTTRDSDGAMETDRRAESANHANAAACISLHASQIGAGIHIYASSLAPTSAGSIIPWKSAQASWVTRSLALAGVLNSAFSQAGIAVTLGRTALPAIDSMACPAVAIEIAPLSAGHGQSVSDPAYQTHIAQALAAAIVEWRSTGLRDSSQTTEAAQP
jgi:N-acetylmuramoyl-L-alanine amidase